MLNKTKLIKLIAIYTFLFVIGTVAYVVSFHTPLFKNVDVFFYRGLSLIVFWGMIIAVIMFFLYKKLSEITIRDVILLFTAFCCINVVFFTHVPVTAERSISIFMLGYMADHPDDSFTEDEVERYFVDKYVGEFGAFHKRFHEQEKTGTIEAAEGGYRITDNGIRLMKLYEIIASLYQIEPKLIHSGG